MKHILFFLLLILSGKAFTQDFNFRFYPSDNFQRYTILRDTDPQTKVISWKNDSMTLSLRSVVEKNGDEFKIYSTTDLTATRYSSHVKFVGMSTDGEQMLVYQAENGAAIWCNPMKGFILVKFGEKCDEYNPGPGGIKCNVSWFTFGQSIKGFRP